MRCPFCSSEDTKVVDKRDSEGSVRRRRECLKCTKRFTTYEHPDIVLTVIKKDGRREQFSRDKLLSGILKACEKRPIEKDAIEEMVNKIETELLRAGDEITSTKIGNTVMKHLVKLDEVAYLRFASVYRSFETVKSFENEIKLIKR